jgi:hypothetical protein
VNAAGETLSVEEDVQIIAKETMSGLSDRALEASGGPAHSHDDDPRPQLWRV